MNNDNPEGYFFFTTRLDEVLRVSRGEPAPGVPSVYFVNTLPTVDGGTPVIFSAVRMCLIPACRSGS
jgi:hypothetical protein